MNTIIGMNLKKISAERKDPKTPSGAMEITTVPGITGVKEIDLVGLGNGLKALSIDFNMKSDIKPDRGSIIIEGSIIYNTDNSKEMAEGWKKNNALPEEDTVRILNHILSKVSIIGLYISDIMGLPPIVGLPKVEAKKKE